MIRRREFTQADFCKVSDFLKKNHFTNSSNWHIDRWNFSRYFPQNWLEIFDTWPSTVGMWVDENDDIIAILCSEGEQEGEVFFQLRQMHYDSQLINEMIDFAEHNLYCEDNGKKILHVRANNLHKKLIEQVLSDRGYNLEEGYEVDSSMQLQGTFDVELPEGFRIMEAKNFSPELRGIAHAKSFRSLESNAIEFIEERTRGYAGLIQAPDYSSDLDLCVVDKVGEIASFATVWFDNVNLIGILEPVGTITKYRKMGLGKAVIHEGINRVMKLGATKIHVGSSQQFYKALGFAEESITKIWTKKF